MPRLRTTTTLSVLALGIGIAGTQWLSDMTGSSAEPVRSHFAHHAVAQRVVAQHVAHRVHANTKYVAATTRPRYVVARVAAPVMPAVPRSEPVQWVPVSMPMAAIPLDHMQNHDAGNLVLHLTVDGQGQVMQSALAQSSGDAVLDADAVAMARHWRFVVPADHPDGFSGDLPLSFGASLGQFAQMP